MRRIGRWMLNALTALSLLMCLATCVLWVRSYGVADEVRWQGPTWFMSTESTEGSIRLLGRTLPPGAHTGYKRTRAHPPRPSSLAWLVAGGDPGVRSHGSIWGLEWVLSDGGMAPEPPSMIPPGRPRGWSPAPVRHPVWREFILRYWILALALGLLPMASLVRVLFLSRDASPNECAACSYDLTGNVSGVCPECGTKIAEAK